MNELSTNLGTVFLARLVVGNLGEVAMPIIQVYTRSEWAASGTVDCTTPIIPPRFPS